MELYQQPTRLNSSSIELPLQSGIHRINSQNNIGESDRVIVHNRYNLSPQYRRPNSPLENARYNGYASPDRGKNAKLDNILFTIQQNHYFRKNSNHMGSRPPKYRVYPKRHSIDQDSQNSLDNREKKVAFTDRLVTDKPPLKKKENGSRGSIIRNGSLNNNKNSWDNSSVSQRSISVQNSFVSQMRTSSMSLKETKSKIDANKRKYYQIKSYFEGGKQTNNEYGLKTATHLKLKYEKEKYSDSIFPPVYSSLFLGAKNKNNSQRFTWKRLSDYASKMNPVVIPNQGKCDLIIELNQSEPNFSYVTIAFNALKFCRCVLDKIFQDQTFNEYGLYLLKIFQHNNWKSIIMDDYIPFQQAQSTEEEVSAFLTVKSNGKWVQLWPLLLLKAFANYYSTYEAMMYGNVLDFLNQVTGLVPLELPLRKKTEKELARLRKHLQIKDSFAIAEMTSHVPRFLIIRMAYLNGKQFMFYSEYPTFNELELQKPIFQKIKKIFVYSPRVYNILSTATIGWYGANSKSQDRSEYSLRKLIIYEQTDCLLSIQQKEARFFSKSSLKYNYMWLRAVLVQREFNGYRWIRGKYSNSKSNILSAALSPGEYYLIIMPEWKKSYNFQLTLLIWANHLVKIQKQKANSCEEMLEQACMDLAQRNGSISQLRPNLCSYNYICGETGLIIENINNQKLKEQIKIHRKITGIPCSVDLVPVNKIFWTEKQLFRGQVDIAIPKASAYTIVLRMKQGIDDRLVRLFSKEKDK